MIKEPNKETNKSFLNILKNLMSQHSTLGSPETTEHKNSLGSDKLLRTYSRKTTASLLCETQHL